MVDFAELLKQGNAARGPRKPPRVFELPLGAWSDERSDKPLAPVAVGIRLLSEEDVQYARSEAAKVAVELIAVGDEDDRIAAFNDALTRFAAERGMCSPESVEDPFFALGELEIRQRMTPEGVRRIWQEIEALHVGCNPSLTEIDDDGLAHLFAMLYRDCLDRLSREDAAHARRLLERVRSMLDEVDDFAETG